MIVQELIRTMSDNLAGSAGVKSVYGDPVTVGDRTVIPVAEVRYGFGAGGGSRKEEEGEGGGGGGGVVMTPAGALEISPEGTRFIPFDDRRKLAAAVATGFALGVLILTLTRKSPR
jgi:uncharacterized spore protein YtfJ